MPRYEYRCELCGFTAERNLAPCDHIITCESCGMPLAPRIHAPVLSSERKTERKPR